MALKNEIPPKLVAMLKARRVIPFLGAGFSSGLNLPDWDTLLAKLSDEIEGSLPYSEIKKFCNGDNLEIAEYYFLISDHRIGPLRHAFETALSTTNIEVLLSAPHVEPVNLGAHQVYTTNYEDLIEKTFRSLNQPVEVISLPKDVATATEARTQVVKYHGDLKHETTLVLTESSYYARLDLESPMDIKFRSDMLGRSVLFIGYSFRDINIRVIWFKLMRLMKDISKEDRPTSFIVTFSPNPVLKRLYQEVGIETICLDPEGKASTAEAKNVLLSRFMLDLSVCASADDNIPGRPGTLQFCSHALTQQILNSLDELARQSPRPRRRSGFGSDTETERLLILAASRSIPAALKGDFDNILDKLCVSEDISAGRTLFTVNYSKHFGVNENVTYLISRDLSYNSSRDILLKEQFSWEALLGSISWKTLWGAKISRNHAERLLKRFQNELKCHQEKTMTDHDIAFLADITHRIIAGDIFDTSQTDIVDVANKLIFEASELYPSIGTYIPTSSEPPGVENICLEIDARYQELREKSEGEDVPF